MTRPRRIPGLLRRPEARGRDRAAGELDFASIPGLVFDLDPRYLVVRSGSDVVSVTDVVGGHVATSVVSAEPQYSAADPTLRYQPSLQFTGAEHMTLPNSSDFNHMTTGTTWFAALYDGGDAASRTLLDYYDLSPNSGWRWNTKSTTTNRVLVAKSGGGFLNFAGGGTNGGAGHVYRFSYNGADEATIVSDALTPVTGAAVGANNTLQDMEIGAVGGTEFGVFNLARLLCWNRELESAEAAAVRAELTARFVG